MRPMLLRPAVFFSGFSNDFSGVDLVISSKPLTLIWRRPGEVGLYLRIGMIWLLLPGSLDLLENVDVLTRVEGHNRLLPTRFVPNDAATATRCIARFRLRLDVERIHRFDTHVEGLLDRVANLRLVG